MPVLVGVTDTSFVESVNLAQMAADAGAAAVVLSAPYYFPAGQPELLEYVEDIASELPLPVFLYNMPSHTKLSFEPETIARALAIPNIVGLKDSSAQMIYFHKVRQLAAERPDFSLLVGPEELLGESVLSGAHGGVCGGANLFPRLYVDLYEAARDRQLDRMARAARAGDAPGRARSTRSASTARRSSRDSSAACRAWASATTSWPSRSSASPPRARASAELPGGTRRQPGPTHAANGVMSRFVSQPSLIVVPRRRTTPSGHRV